MHKEMKVLEMFENKSKFMTLNPNFQPGQNKRDPLEQANDFELAQRALNED